MMNANIKKIVASGIIMFFATSIPALGQSNGDVLFAAGQKLQKVLTIDSQRKAIKKFKSAKVIYTNANKKAICDTQISICNSNIKSLNSKTSKGRKNSESRSESNSQSATLQLSQDYVAFDGNSSGNIEIRVNAPQNTWDFNIPKGVEGEDDFVAVKQSTDFQSLSINVKANNKTIERRQSINVTSANLTKSITVVQSGKEVKLSTSENLLSYAPKGGHKSMAIYTNSDSIIADNNDLCWYIESKPDWAAINVNVKKNKSLLNKGLSAIKGLVADTNSAANDKDINITNIEITVLPIKKSDPNYKTGRKGEIVFASQDKRYKVNIVQKK